MLMKALVICPHERAGVALLAERQPLALLPVCGRALIEHWLEYLAAQGARTVTILASDRPEQVREVVGNGRKWGLTVKVLPEVRELSVEEAREKYQDGPDGWLPAPMDAIVLDGPPGEPVPAFESYRSWAAAVQMVAQSPPGPTRIGLKEVQPGIRAGLRTRIHPRAVLRAPCWIEDDAQIDAGAVIGPNTVIDRRCLIKQGAEVVDSLIGPETFVGAFTEVRHSIATGNQLINCKTGSHVNVPDPFLLSRVSAPPFEFDVLALFGRVAAAVTMMLTAPLALYVCLKCAWRGQHPLREVTAVRLVGGLTGQTLERFHFYEFTNVNRWVRRWPQLWSILVGDFRWVGNRPISASKAARLHNEFERLWLHAPAGLVSLADVRGWVDSFSDEARAHSSFYAVQRNWRLDTQILCRAPIMVALSAQKLWENQLVPSPVRQWLREEYPTNYRF
jgi:hypothetical protein